MALLCRAFGGSTSTANSVGDVLFAGGAGGAAAFGAGFGGGGGSSGGPGSAGNAGASGAAGGAGGAAVSGGGAGGNGGTSAPTSGVAGSAPGGGGGGAGSNGTTGGSTGSNGGNGQVVISGTTFSTPGVFTYTVGAGVTSVVIECWGGGDIGGPAGTNSSSGGNGGVYAKKTAAVTPGQKLVVSVGPGGVSGSGTGSPSLVYTYPPFSFVGADDWVFNAGGSTGLTAAVGFSGGPPSVDANDPLGGPNWVFTRSGKNLSTGTPYIEWSGTWENLGVPPGATVTAVNLTYDWACGQYITGAAGTVGPAELRDSAGTLRGTFSTAQAFSAVSSSWATPTGTNQTGLTDPSNTSIKLRIGGKPNTGSSNSAAVVLGVDYVQVTITYTVPGVVRRTQSIVVRQAVIGAATR